MLRTLAVGATGVALTLTAACSSPIVDPIARVTMTPATLELLVGDSAAFRAEVVGTDGQTMRARLRWYSSDSTVVAVRQDGMVLARRGGPALVAAVAGTHNAISRVDVIHPPLSGPREYAHRAYAAIFPENTVIAVDSALGRGAHGVEVDVRLSADRVPVIMHDVSVDRTTDGTGRVIDLTSSQLRALDACSWKGSGWAPCPVPFASEILDAARGRGRVLLDLKGPWPAQDLAALVGMVHQRGMRDSVTFISFSLDQLIAVRKLDARIALGHLSFSYPDPTRALTLGPTAILVAKDSLLAIGAPAAAYAAQLRARGSLLGAFTLVSKSSVAPLRDLGVSWYITDVPLAGSDLGAPTP